MADLTFSPRRFSGMMKPVQLEDFFALQTETGQAALAAAEARQPREADYLPHFTALSRSFPPALARAALETAILRQEAGGKFPQAGTMYFVREALEQASSATIAAYRSQRYQGFARLLDLGCSIGADTLALARHAPTFGIDLDLLRLHMAAANTRAAPFPAAFLQADLAAPLPLAGRPETGVFWDPARRKAGRRVFSVRDYLPPLHTALPWLARFPALGIKISPGVDLAEIAGLPAEVEFISVGGELKEAVLWFGPLRTTERRATLLPGALLDSAPLDSATLASAAPEPPAELSPPLAYLYEPDPAVLRAGLVGALARRLPAFQLDSQIAYLTSAHLQPTPFARAWQIETWLPFHLKRLRAFLRAEGVGRVTVKKRGSPLEIEAFIRSLRLAGPEEKTLVLTQMAGAPVVLVCAPGPLPRGAAAAGAEPRG